MDRLGDVTKKVVGEPPARPRAPRESKPSSAPSDEMRTRFRVEAATIELSASLSFIQRMLPGPASETGAGGVGAPTGQPSSEEILASTRAFVKDIFERHGITFEELTPDEAQQKIADGGEQSPDAVAKRILDFVKGFATGDPGRAELLRDAVEQGFEEAGAAWGSRLPDISYQTMDLVRKGLDELFGTGEPDAAPQDPPKAARIDLTA
jgi:hypothetical protein